PTANCQRSDHGAVAAGAASESIAAVGKRDCQLTWSWPGANATVAWPPETSMPGVSTASFASNATGRVKAPCAGATRVSVVVTCQSMSNATRRTTLTYGGNTLPPSAP